MVSPSSKTNQQDQQLTANAAAVAQNHLHDTGDPGGLSSVRLTCEFARAFEANHRSGILCVDS